MKRISTTLLLVIVLALIVSGCTKDDYPVGPDGHWTLDGAWAVNGVKTLGFTGQQMMMWSGSTMVTFGYTDLGNGQGKYWLPSSPNAKVAFTYSFSDGGRTLTFGIPSQGITLTLQRY